MHYKTHYPEFRLLIFTAFKSTQEINYSKDVKAEPWGSFKLYSEVYVLLERVINVYK